MDRRECVNFAIYYRRKIFVKPETLVFFGLFSYGNLTINMI